MVLPLAIESGIFHHMGSIYIHFLYIFQLKGLTNENHTATSLATEEEPMAKDFPTNWASPYSNDNDAALSLRIGGERVDGTRQFDIINPANGRIIGKGCGATTTNLEAALSACDSAFSSWRRTSAQKRAEILARAGAILLDNLDELALTMTLEQGKPIAQSRLEFVTCAETFTWYAAEALRTSGRVMPSRATGGRQSTLPEPVGPVAALTPWNFPALLAARKIAPALAAGCTCILKPAEETPASSIALADALAIAGLPDGVLNVVFGEPSEISSMLISSSVIRKISFTGSVLVGRHLAALAGRHLKPCTLELGGHAPVLVMDDSDPVKAAAISAIGKTRNAGQVCTSPTRFYVQDRIYDDFLSEFTKEMAGIAVGNGILDSSDMGPLANERRVSAMEALINDAVARGASIETGGHRIGNEGCFFAPTVLSGVPDDAEIMQTEPFGPVAIVSAFGSLDEALLRANSADVGLAGYAFTNSHPRATAISDGLEVGMVGINSFAVSHVEAPFGGVKDSGYGYEGGIEGLEAYLHKKYVHHA